MRVIVIIVCCVGKKAFIVFKSGLRDWFLPSGDADRPNESFGRCAIRIAKEVTGLTVDCAIVLPHNHNPKVIICTVPNQLVDSVPRGQDLVLLEINRSLIDESSKQLSCRDRDIIRESYQEILKIGRILLLP